MLWVDKKSRDNDLLRRGLTRGSKGDGGGRGSKGFPAEMKKNSSSRNLWRAGLACPLLLGAGPRALWWILYDSHSRWELWERSSVQQWKGKCSHSHQFSAALLLLFTFFVNFILILLEMIVKFCLPLHAALDYRVMNFSSCKVLTEISFQFFIFLTSKTHNKRIPIMVREDIKYIEIFSIFFYNGFW